jgi:solute carrier family 13 (sodium-dependent dicarboxylate transporter), member 2/3/5
MSKPAKLYTTAFAILMVWIIPTRMIPIEDLSIIEHRVIVIFLLAILLWVMEPIPVYATSILILVMLLVTVSDQSFILFQLSADADNYGVPIPYQEIMARFASPVIMLFLGGFFLAMAAAKYKLDVNLADILLRPFGTNPKYVLFGLILITALFSMFISNTATAAMMLSLLGPVLARLNEDDRGKIAFGLAIPLSANIGGIGTIIGTPPNAISIQYLPGEHEIGFGEWMAFAIPFVMVLLLFLWILLLRFYPVKTEKIDPRVGGAFSRSWKAVVVYCTFGATIVLWVLDFVHGMNAYVVAMIPVAVFSVTAIITRDDLRNISWDVLWLVAGGLALGMALEKTGLAENAIGMIPFGLLAPLLIVALTSLLALGMSNFISNTATANLLLPLMVALGTGLPELYGIGGLRYIVLSVTFACSLGMAMPISTPPNAIAHSYGYFETKDMMKMGSIIGGAGIVLAYAYLYTLTAVADVL